MTLRIVSVLVSLAIIMPAGDAGADFLVYKLGTKGKRRMGRGQGTAAMPSSPPQGAGMYGSGGASGSGREVVLYGTVKKEGGGIMYTHPEVSEPLIFQPNQVEIKHAPTFKAQYQKMLVQAGKDPQAVMRAAVWALKKGLFVEFHHGVEKVLTLDPQHEAASRVRDLKTKIDLPLPDDHDAAAEKQLRSMLKLTGMQTETSNHFILLHDTHSKAESGHHLSRAKERLRLLEQMYKKFVLLFEAQGVTLDLPHDRFRVVLFKRLSDFQDMAARLDVRLDDVAGFWSPGANVICLYDDSTTTLSRELKDEKDKLDKVAADAKKNGSSLERQRDSETIRQIKINGVLIDIDRWRSDVASTSREAAHLLAANMGLLPRRVGIPTWVHEGLAMYFESPSDEAWGGIGAVDDLRIEDYSTLQNDRVQSNIDFIIEDRSLASFPSAAAQSDSIQSEGARLGAAAQVWSLTHFMFENHARELMTYYKMLGDMPADVALNPELLGQLFSHAFGDDHVALQREWRGYMRTLKSDVERMEAAGEEGE